MPAGKHQQLKSEKPLRSGPVLWGTGPPDPHRLLKAGLTVWRNIVQIKHLDSKDKSRSDRLADALLRDILDKPAATKPAPVCHACGRSYSGAGYGVSGRFCSERCVAAYDAGLPAFEPGYVSRITAMPLSAWRIVAGPPDIEIGSNPWQSIIAASERKRAKLDLIRPRKLCESCGAKLPVWVNGRKVSAARKLCDGCR
jgi:hypothetical protein